MKSREPGQFAWLGSYAGICGISMLGVAVFILAHADWLFGALAAACGISGLQVAYRRRS